MLNLLVKRYETIPIIDNLLRAVISFFLLLSFNVLSISIYCFLFDNAPYNLSLQEIIACYILFEPLYIFAAIGSISAMLYAKKIVGIIYAILFIGFLFNNLANYIQHSGMKL